MNNARKSVVGLLNKILADEAVVTIKTRRDHMNIQGVYFHELYNLYTSQYQRLNAISDEIADHVRMLGGYTIGSLLDYDGNHWFVRDGIVAIPTNNRVKPGHHKAENVLALLSY